MIIFAWLKVGIEIDKLKIYGHQVSGLYIKLDKKLTLIADSIIIPRSKREASLGESPLILKRIKYLLTFFQKISLRNIIFENNIIHFKFEKEQLQIENKKYHLIGEVKIEEESLKASLKKLYLKEYNVTLEGNLTYHLKSESIISKGNFRVEGIQGEFNLTKIKEKVAFSLRSDSFVALKRVVDKFELSPSVRSWIVERVEANKYQLLSLKGEGSIVDNAFELDFKMLSAKVLFEETKIHFQTTLKPILAPSFVLEYRDNRLDFTLHNPTYKRRDMEGSGVSIVNLMDDNTTLKLDIRLKTVFDKTIKELLNAYDISLPITQKKGALNARLKANVGLKKSQSDFIVDVKFNQGDIWIKRVRLPITQGLLHYEEGKITLKEIGLKEKNYEGKVSGELLLKKYEATLVCDLKRLKLGEKKIPFLMMKNKKLPLVLNYAKGLKITIPKLSLTLEDKKKNLKLSLQNLNKIKPYLLNPSLVGEGGDMTIYFKDLEHYTFMGKVRRKECFFYDKTHRCKTILPFKGTVTPKGTIVYGFDKRLKYQKSKSRLFVNGINIDLKKLLKLKKKEEKNKKNKKGKKLLILGKNSHIRYDNYTLLLESYDIDLKANGDIKAMGSARGDIVKFSKKRDVFSLQALRVKDRVLHPLINFRGLQKGRYSLKKWGNPEGVMHGEIIVEGGVMKNFKAYNNTLAFINTLPALAVLHNPGFSEEGFIIEEGVVEYRMIKTSKILFDSIYIKGRSATIVGKGEIDLKRKTIKMNLAIQVGRELGKVLGSLPLLGYILMGEDKSITVGLELSGKLDKPIVKTSAGEDILTLPLQLLKRTLESPKHLINR